MRIGKTLRFWFFATALLFVPHNAHAESEKGTITAPMIQGVWSRDGGDHRWVIKGNTLSEYKLSNPNRINNSGAITYPRNKPFALVSCRNGGKFRVYHVTEGIIAFETINPNGSIYGDGRLFYRDNAR